MRALATSRSVAVLLLADSSAAQLTPPKWLQAWDLQLVLLSMKSGDCQAQPVPEVLQAVQGNNLLRSDQNGWVAPQHGWGGYACGGCEEVWIRGNATASWSPAGWPEAGSSPFRTGTGHLLC